MLNTENLERQKNAPEDQHVILLDNLKDDMIKMPYSMYKFSKCQPVQGASYASSSNNAILTTPQLTKFQVPVSGDYATNFSHYVLNFSVAVGIVSPSAPLNGFAATTYQPCPWRYYFPWFQSLLLRAGNGTVLCNVQNLDKYCRMTSVYNTSNETTTGSTIRKFGCKSQRTDIFANTTTSTAPIVLDPYITSTGAITATANYNAEAIDDSAILTYPTNAAIANYNAGYPFPYQNQQIVNATGDVCMFDVSVRIGDIIKESIFNVNRDIPFNNNVTLEFTWNPVDSIFVPILILSAALPFSVSPTNASTTFPGIGYEVYGLTMTYAYQRNSEMRNVIIGAQQDGDELAIVVPYIDFSTPQAISAAQNSQIATMRISTQNAYTSLSHIFYGLFLADANSLVNNSNNIGETTYNALQIQHNGDILCDLDLKGAKEDIMMSERFFNLNGGRSYQAIRYSGCVPYVFNSECLPDTIYDGRTTWGIPLVNQNDLIMTFNVKTGAIALLTHYMFHCTLRTFYWKGGNVFLSKQIF